MDYKSKYEEALERAKTFQEQYGGDYAGFIFPELCESEDEKIRKEILNYLNMLHRRHRLDIEPKGKYSLHDMVKYLIELFHKEQKPAEWNEKPCQTCDEYDKGYKQGYTEGCTAGYNKAMLEQKPADDKAFEMWLNDWYQGSKELGGDVVMSEAEFKNWSRGIRNMYKQKQEWSEEDEKMIQSIVLELQGLIDFSPNPPDFEIRVRKEQNWLKSLRDRAIWKPNEQEINELHGALIPGHGYDCDVLQGLYTDLKKLMEDEQ